MRKINIAAINKESIVDGPGIRYTIFFQGCEHGCPGCHNSSSHPIGTGVDVEIETIANNFLANPYLDGLTISGGEPLLQYEALIELLKYIRSKNNNMNIILYTGYTLEYLESTETYDELFHYINTLVDGPYIESLRDIKSGFTGSTNQKIYQIIDKVVKK